MKQKIPKNQKKEAIKITIHEELEILTQELKERVKRIKILLNAI